MNKANRMLWFLMFIGFLMGFSACGEKEPVPEKSAVQEQPKTKAKQALENSPEPAMSVTFYPDSPTSADEIRASLTHVPPGYTLTWERNGQTIKGEHSERLPPGKVRSGDTLKVKVDYGNGTLEQSVEIHNSPPEVVAVNFAEPRIHRGVDIVLEPVAEDRDGDPIGFDYAWFINGKELTDVFGDTLPGDRFHKGDRIAVKVVALDAMERGEPFLGREFVIPGAPPHFTSEPPAQFSSLVHTYRADVRDPDGDSVIFSLEKAPEGMTINTETGEIAWSLEGEAAGEYRVRVKATDSDGLSALQEYSLVLGDRGQEG